MTRFAGTVRTTPLLLAANALLALVIAVELLTPAGRSASAVATPTEPDEGLPEFGDVAARSPDMSDLVDLLGRPLFYVDRRMPAPAEKAAAPPPSPLRLELEGIAIAGGSRVAVLRNLANNQLLQLAEGDAHEGWTLDSVSATSASFSRGEQTTELPLDPGANGRRR